MGLFAKKSTAKVAPADPETAPSAKRTKKQKSTTAKVAPPAGGSASEATNSGSPAAGGALPTTLMVLGCDGAGKTALAAAIVGKALSEPPKPTSGFQNFEGRFREAPTLTVLDVGGNAGVRSIWDDYYTEAHGFIFVVDASAPERFAEAANLLRTSYAHEAVHGKPLLVLASKQDYAHAIDAAELAEVLRVHELDGAGSSCLIGAGSLGSDFTILAGSQLEQGVSWLLRRVKSEGAALRERVERQVAEQKEKERAAKEARKARLAAKRAAREKAAAEEEARAKAEAAVLEQQQPPPPPPAEPPPSPPSSSPPPSPPATEAAVRRGGNAPPAFPFHSF